MSYKALFFRCSLLLLFFPFFAAAQTVSLAAGDCALGITGPFMGNGGPATAADIAPSGVAIDHAGNLYIAQLQYNYLCKVSPAGIIVAIAGTGVPGYSGDGGPAYAAQLRVPRDVVVGPSDNIYVSDGSLIRKIDAAGIITTVAGMWSTTPIAPVPDGGPATAGGLGNTLWIAFDNGGNMYIGDGGSVRKVNTSGIISTIAGIGMGNDGDGGPATAAHIKVDGIAVSSSGEIYISDAYANSIRKIDGAGIISTIPISAPLLRPQRLAFSPAGDLYVTEKYTGTGLKRIGMGGTVTTVLQMDASISTEDCTLGDASVIRLKSPSGMAFDNAGNMYVSDDRNHRVLKMAAPTTAVGGPVGQPIAMGITPNPSTTGTFTINMGSGKEEQADVTIMDLLGHVVKTLDIAANVPASVALDAPPGLYLIKACTRSGTLWAGKVVIAR